MKDLVGMMEGKRRMRRVFFVVRELKGFIFVRSILAWWIHNELKITALMID